MRGILLLAMSLAILTGESGTAAAQTYHRLQCQGQSVQGSVVIGSVRSLGIYNAIGDGYVRFDGRVRTSQLVGRLQYEGYTNLAPFDGLITGSFAPVFVAVLDNTNGEMIIYEGGAQLGAPEILAQLVCD